MVNAQPALWPAIGAGFPGIEDRHTRGYLPVSLSGIEEGRSGGAADVRSDNGSPSRKVPMYSTSSRCVDAHHNCAAHSRALSRCKFSGLASNDRVGTPPAGKLEHHAPREAMMNVECRTW